MVGYSSFVEYGFSHAFVDAGAGLVDLNTVTAGLGSEVLMDAVGINDAGQIVAKASVSEEEILLVEADLDALDTQRTHWPFFRDRRIDAYGDIQKRFID